MFLEDHLNERKSHFGLNGLSKQQHIELEFPIEQKILLGPNQDRDYLNQQNLQRMRIFQASSSGHGHENGINLSRKGELICDDLYPHFKAFLIFGKCIGLVPFKGLLQKSVHKLQFERKFNLTLVVSILIWILLGVNTAVASLRMGRVQFLNPAQYASMPAGIIFNGLGLFIYVYYFGKSKAIIEILQKWSRMELCFTKLDINLTRDVNLLAGITLTSAISENIVSHWKTFTIAKADELERLSLLEIFYNREQGRWAEIVAFNPVLAVCLFVCNKFAVYAWNYMDLTIVIFARAIYFKFELLFLLGEANLFRENNGSKTTDLENWRLISNDHSTLYEMLSQMVSFLSPFIFASYAVNIYFIILQLHSGLTPSGNRSTLDSFYFKWSFLHLIGRLLLVSIVGSKVHFWAHKSCDLFRRCPQHAYTIEVKRAERFVQSNTIGLNGLNCFVLTKSLILKIVGVVFTFEIVLLQATQSTTTTITTQVLLPLLPVNNESLNSSYA